MQTRRNVVPEEKPQLRGGIAVVCISYRSDVRLEGSREWKIERQRETTGIDGVERTVLVPGDG